MGRRATTTQHLSQPLLFSTAALRERDNAKQRSIERDDRSHLRLDPRRLPKQPRASSSSRRDCSSSTSVAADRPDSTSSSIASESSSASSDSGAPHRLMQPRRPPRAATPAAPTQAHEAGSWAMGTLCEADTTHGRARTREARLGSQLFLSAILPPPLALRQIGQIHLRVSRTAFTLTVDNDSIQTPPQTSLTSAIRWTSTSQASFIAAGSGLMRCADVRNPLTRAAQLWTSRATLLFGLERHAPRVSEAIRRQTSSLSASLMNQRGCSIRDAGISDR